MPKVLVTGGAGFIGSHVADLFLAKGFDTTIVDDLSSGKRENLPAAARFIETGVNSAEFSALIREGRFDVIAHLGAQIDVRHSVADPINDATINLAPVPEPTAAAMLAVVGAAALAGRRREQRNAAQ